MGEFQQEMTRLSKQIATLEARLGEVTGELVDLRAVMAPFLERYQTEVLRYHTELVQVQRHIADLKGERGELSALDSGNADTPLSRLVSIPDYVPVQEQYDRVWRGKQPPRPEDLQDDLPAVSPAIKRLYAEIVAHLHPELAETLQERERRTQLIQEVNRAYVNRDEVSLQAMAEAHRSHSNLPAIVDEQAVKKLKRRLFMIEQVVAKVEGQLFDLRHGDVAKVRAYTEHARRTLGRDFIADLGKELQAELRQAQQELAELRTRH